MNDDVNQEEGRRVLETLMELNSNEILKLDEYIDFVFTHQILSSDVGRLLQNERAYRRSENEALSSVLASRHGSKHGAQFKMLLLEREYMEAERNRICRLSAQLAIKAALLESQSESLVLTRHTANLRHRVQSAVERGEDAVYSVAVLTGPLTLAQTTPTRDHLLANVIRARFFDDDNDEDGDGKVALKKSRSYFAPTLDGLAFFGAVDADGKCRTVSVDIVFRSTCDRVSVIEPELRYLQDDMRIPMIVLHAQDDDIPMPMHCSETFQDIPFYYAIGACSRKGQHRISEKLVYLDVRDNECVSALVNDEALTFMTIPECVVLVMLLSHKNFDTSFKVAGIVEKFTHKRSEKRATS